MAVVSTVFRGRDHVQVSAINWRRAEGRRKVVFWQVFDDDGVVETRYADVVICKHGTR